MITIRKAADTNLVRQLKNSTGAVVNLTDATYSCDLRETPTSSASVSITPIVILAASGLYKIPIASSILTNLSNRTYYCKNTITISTIDYDDSFYLKILDNTGITIAAAHSAYGTTANRPTLTSTDTGFTYYDTDSKSLIVWNGIAWSWGLETFRGSYTTAEKLALDTSGYSIGDWIFDTDLLSPYWFDGSVWV